MRIWCKHSVYTHFPKDRNCEICQRTTITRAPCRRRIGRVVPREEIFGDLITADHKVLSEGCESRNNHRYAVVVHDLATQWIQSHLHWQFLGIWQSLWRSLLESLHVYTTQIRDKWDCWESSAQSKGRYVCRVVAIRSEWTLVGRFYWMLHLSAKRHRFIIWWEDALWKTFWATIKWTDCSIWFIGWVLPYLCEGPVKNPSIWKESVT